MTDKFIRKALVTNIVDGDTFDAIVDLGYKITTKQRFRILGINAPEMTGQNRPLGLISKQFTVDTLLNKEVVIRSIKTDSFGRWLGEVFFTDENGDEISFGDLMIELELAKVY